MIWLYVDEHMNLLKKILKLKRILSKVPCKIGTLFLAQKSNIFNANFAEFVEENVNL